MIEMEKTGAWGQAIKIFADASRNMPKRIKVAIKQEAQFLRAQIVKGIASQAPGGEAFAPLSQNTLKVRRLEGFGGTKALIRTGELRAAITVIETDNGDTIFVGILRSARAKSGDSLANIADIHENGRGPFLVPITRASRGFLGAAGVMAPGPGKFVVIRIPARPFIRPVFEKFGKTEMVRERVLRRIADSFKGDLGG